MRILMTYAPSHEYRYTDLWGYRRVASLRDHMESQGFVGLGCLPKTVETRIIPGDWAIDAGANVGLITAALCHHVGSGGRVWAVEPLPRNVARLDTFRDENQLSQLRVIPGALANLTGNVLLRLPKGGESGWASLTKSWDTSTSISVASFKLDDLVFEAPVKSPVRFIKIDVEGAEPALLIGAQRTLQEMRPLVFCEFNDILLRDSGSSGEALLHAFSTFGYQPTSEFKEQAKNLSGAVVDLLLESK